MIFGLTVEKVLLLALLSGLLIGPERLPGAAVALRRYIRLVRDWGDRAKDRLTEEIGPEAADLDWTKLDPRQYDPRRIIREALLEPAATSASPQEAAVPVAAAPSTSTDQKSPISG